MTNFSQKITEKFNDKNFLLWKQQIESAITPLGLNNFIASPQVPPRYLSEARQISSCLALVYSLELNACLCSWIIALGQRRDNFDLNFVIPISKIDLCWNFLERSRRLLMILLQLEMSQPIASTWTLFLKVFPGTSILLLLL